MIFKPSINSCTKKINNLRHYSDSFLKTNYLFNEHISILILPENIKSHKK